MKDDEFISRIMTAIAWAALVVATLRVSFLSVSTYLPPYGPDRIQLAQYFLLNGLPILLFCYVAQYFVHRGFLFLTVLLFADVFGLAFDAKYRVLQEPLMFSDIQAFMSAPRVISTGFATSSARDFLFFMNLLVPVAAWKRLGRKRIPKDGLGRKIETAVFAVFLVSVFLFVNFIRRPLVPVPVPEPVSETQKAQIAGSLSHFVRSGLPFLTNRAMRARAPDRGAVKDAMDRLSSARAADDPHQLRHSSRRPNVVVILFESLGSDAVEAPKLHAAGRDATPFINSLRDELFFSTNIFSPTTCGMTSDCEFTVLNSLRALPDLGYMYTYHMDHDYRGLAGVLREEGYYTAVFHAYKRNFYHRENAYRRMGFDRYDSKEDYEPGEIVGWGLSDKDFLAQTAVKLRGLPEPYFAFIITLSSHSEYDIPKGLEKGVTRGIEGVTPYARNYVETLSYSDGALESFWKASADIREKSIVVIFGDHQGLPSDEDIRSLGFKIKNAYDSRLMHYRVPVVISAPFLKGVVNPAQGVIGDESDIAPTILDLAGVPSPPYFVGDSLFRKKGYAVGGKAEMFAYDGRRMCDLSSGSCFDFAKGRICGKSGCDGLVKRAGAAMTVSEDIIVGKGFAMTPLEDKKWPEK